MKINGVEFDIDFTDADTLELIEKESAKVGELAAELRQRKESLSPAEGIRQECKIVKDFLDSVLGSGASEKIFGNRDSLTLCLDAYEGVIKTYQEQYKAYNDRINKYSPDRYKR